MNTNTKKLYEFGSYDKNGNLNGSYFVIMVLFIFFGINIISFIIVDFITHYIKFNEFINIQIIFKDLFDLVKNIYYNSFTFYLKSNNISFLLVLVVLFITLIIYLVKN